MPLQVSVYLVPLRLYGPVQRLGILALYDASWHVTAKDSRHIQVSAQDWINDNVQTLPAYVILKDLRCPFRVRQSTVEHEPRHPANRGGRFDTTKML